MKLFSCSRVLLITMLITVGSYLSVKSAIFKPLDSVKATKKVLLIGVDGLQYEKIKQQHTPNFDAFKMVKAYAGGIVGTPSQQTTGSGPGWMTILTGVWTDQHGVISNDTSNKCKAKSVFQYLKDYNPKLQTTSIATWSAIHDFLNEQMSAVDKRLDGGTDKNATARALSELEKGDPDFMFVHFSDPDNIGHAIGYGQKYDESIRATDAYLGEIMEAIRNRKEKKNEEWLVILTTDHGRRGDGHNHGSQTIEEKTVFIGMNVLGNKEFNTIIPEVPNKEYQGIYQYAPQTGVLPTILTYLNVPIASDWQLSSPSLIGKEGPRRVMINPKKNALYWYSTASGNAKIYKDKKLIATVPAQQGGYPISPAMDQEQHTYTVMVNGQSGSATRENLHISATINWKDTGRACFVFNDHSYAFYDKLKNKSESGFPKPLANNLFSGLGEYAKKVETIVNWGDGKLFIFLNDGTYMRYDFEKNKIESGYPKEINDTSWPGLEPYKNEIIAAVKVDDTKAYFFTRDGRYMVFNVAKNKTETISAQPINEKTLPGLKPYATKISAIIDWSSEFFYIFLKDNSYLKYDKINNKVIDGYPMPVNDQTWPGLMKQL